LARATRLEKKENNVIRLPSCSRSISFAALIEEFAAREAGQSDGLATHVVYRLRIPFEPSFGFRVAVSCKKPGDRKMTWLAIGILGLAALSVAVVARRERHSRRPRLRLGTLVEDMKKRRYAD
jgi:hypothetical protein